MVTDAERVQRYKQVREAARQLIDQLLAQLPKGAVTECGKKLGIARGKTLVLGSEDELAVLAEYCLFYHRLSGKNAIQRLLERQPPAEGSDERVVLEAMTKAWYSLFQVEEVHEGVGVTVRDLLRQQSLRVMDLGLGRSARPRLTFAGHVVPVLDWHISTGAPLPVTPQIVDAVQWVLQKYLPRRPTGQETLRLSPGQEAGFAAQIIRIILRAGLSQHVRYE